jgi:hypothetical protein
MLKNCSNVSSSDELMDSFPMNLCAFCWSQRRDPMPIWRDLSRTDYCCRSSWKLINWWKLTARDDVMISRDFDHKDGMAFSSYLDAKPLFPTLRNSRNGEWYGLLLPRIFQLIVVNVCTDPNLLTSLNKRRLVDDAITREQWSELDYRRSSDSYIEFWLRIRKIRIDRMNHRTCSVSIQSEVGGCD